MRCRDDHTNVPIVKYHISVAWKLAYYTQQIEQLYVNSFVSCKKLDATSRNSFELYAISLQPHRTGHETNHLLSNQQYTGGLTTAYEAKQIILFTDDSLIPYIKSELNKGCHRSGKYSLERFIVSTEDIPEAQIQEISNKTSCYSILSQATRPKVNIIKQEIKV